MLRNPRVDNKPEPLITPAAGRIADFCHLEFRDGRRTSLQICLCSHWLASFGPSQSSSCAIVHAPNSTTVRLPETIVLNGDGGRDGPTEPFSRAAGDYPIG